MYSLYSYSSSLFLLFLLLLFFFFFFNDTATTEIYTLSLHDALPIWLPDMSGFDVLEQIREDASLSDVPVVVFTGDRKSTRLNSSHLGISYAVFCLKKKKKKIKKHIE